MRCLIGQSDMEPLPRLNVSEDDAKQVFGGRRSVAVTGNVDWHPSRQRGGRDLSPRCVQKGRDLAMFDSLSFWVLVEISDLAIFVSSPPQGSGCCNGVCRIGARLSCVQNLGGSITLKLALAC